MNTRIDGASCQIIPDDLYTSGEPSLNNLAAAAGDRFDVWQRQINRIILAKSADGFWSARNAVLSIPRQTGKTYDIGWVAIHRAARTPGMRIVWTAQHFSVIKDTFESLCAIVLRPEMSGLVDPDHGISLAAGKEEIRFRNGSRIFFRARERGALRGVKKIALLVIDEAQHLSDSAMASMLPTRTAPGTPRPSTWAHRPAQGTTAKHSPAYATKRAQAAPTAPSTWNSPPTATPTHSTASNGGKPTPATRPTPATNPSPTYGKTSPATTSAAKPSASGTNTPSAAPSTHANGKKPPSTNAAPAASRASAST